MRVREGGHRSSEAHGLFNLSLALYQFGRRTDAVERVRAALVIFEQIKDPGAAIVREQLTFQTEG